MQMYNIYQNKKFKTMYEVKHEKWKYGYNIYTQDVDNDIFVTFYTDDFSEKIHFNNSGSIDICAYTKEERLKEMIETAKKLGWISK